jgi:hypothetical protein
MGQAPLMLFTTTLLTARNQRILTAWNARQEDSQRRAAVGPPPKTRKRRRKTLAGLAAGPPRPPAPARHQHARPQHNSGPSPAPAPQDASTAHPAAGQPECQTQT